MALTAFTKHALKLSLGESAGNEVIRALDAVSDAMRDRPATPPQNPEPEPEPASATPDADTPDPDPDHDPDPVDS